jgi:hypothetical protein
MGKSSNTQKLNIVGVDQMKPPELWSLYSSVVRRLKEIGQIRSNNITGERGEQLAISYYNSTVGLPKLQAAPKGTQNVDAISKRGDRYTIKTIMIPHKTTGVFYGMGTPDNPLNDKKFEYLVIVLINEYYELDKIIELIWEDLLTYKKWHSRMNAFNINLTKELLSKAKIIYYKDGVKIV